jgi:dUTP pyrophosphatase
MTSTQSVSTNGAPPPQTWAPIRVKALNDHALGMSASYPDDAGLDLICSQDMLIPYGEFRDIPTGVAVELPPGTWAMIVGRSSTYRKRHLLVTTGIIDPGYRGELFAGAANLGRYAVQIRRGERLAQLILFHNVTARHPWEWVTELTGSDRDVSGFGSSGQ